MAQLHIELHTLQSEGSSDAFSMDEPAEYNCQKFIRAIRDLEETSILYTWIYSNDTLRDFHEMNTPPGNDSIGPGIVMDFVNRLRSMNREILSKEIEYYREEMATQEQKGMESLTRKAFREIVTGYHSGGILIDVFMEVSSGVELVSIGKVRGLLKDIEDDLEKDFQSSLTAEVLKQQKIHKSQIIQDEPPQWGKPQINILTSMQEYSIKTMLFQYLTKNRLKLQLYEDYITDAQKREDIMRFRQENREKEQIIMEELCSVLGSWEELSKQGGNFKHILVQINEKETLYEEILEQYKQEIRELQDNISQADKQRHHLSRENASLEYNLVQFRQQLIAISLNYQSLTQQLQDKRTDYGQLFTSYNEMIQSHHIQIELKSQKQSNKIFVARTLSEQLEDAISKIDRLNKQKQAERRRRDELQTLHGNTMDQMDGRIRQLQEQIRIRRDHLNSYIKSSMDFRGQSIRSSRISEINDQLWSSSRINPEQDSPNKSAVEGPLLMMSKSKYGRSSKFDSIGFPPINEQRSEVEEVNLTENPKIHLDQLPKQSNIIALIDQDDLNVEDGMAINRSSTWHNFSKANKVSLLKNVCLNVSIANESDIKLQGPNYFICPAHIINVHGQKFETSILFTKRRFCFFDSKLRIKLFVPYKNLASITFSYHNSSLFVIKVRRPGDLDRKIHIVNDMMFSIRMRRELVHFLSKRILDVLRVYEVKMRFEKQDHIYVRNEKAEVNLKYKVPRSFNPYKLAVSDNYVFFGEITEDGFLNGKQQACLFIQPLGILCFGGNENSELEQGRHFLFLLPFVESMKIMEKQNSKTATGRKIKISYDAYSNFDKSYTLVINSRQQLKRFMRKIEQQRQSIKTRKNQQFEKYNKMLNIY